MQRITGKHTLLEACMEIGEGNPGALTVLKEIVSRHLTNAWTYVLLLDQLGLYGSKVWVLYKDICREDLDRMLTLLDNYRSGDHYDPRLQALSEGDGRGCVPPQRKTNNNEGEK